MELKGKITTIRNGRKVVVLKPGRYAAGYNVYLQVTSETAASWIFMAQMAGRRREIGLGSFIGTGRAVTLNREQAQTEAEKIRTMLRAGQDPRAVRARKTAAPTLAAVLDLYMADKAGAWKGSGTEAQWRQQLGKHCPALLATPVDRIDTETVLAEIRPIWKRTLGNTQRLRLEALLDYARVKKHREGDNPARWDGHLEHLMVAPTHKGKTNHAALPFAETPAFLKMLAGQGSVAAKVFIFTILTAVRVAEAAEAVWSEIDLEAGRWVIPAGRMKAGEAHVVPLSRQAVELLRGLERRGEYVFPAAKDAGKPTSTKLLNELNERLGFKGKATVHGFRSTFRDWGNAQTLHDRARFEDQDLEWCLAHAITDKVKKAYLRSDAVERRAVIMQAWADALTGSNVVQLRGVA
jgi:integrase